MDLEALNMIVQLGPLGSGRTFNLAELCVQKNATLLVAFEQQAEELRRLDAELKVISFSQLPEQVSGPIYFDHGFVQEAITRLVADLKKSIDPAMIYATAKQLQARGVKPREEDGSYRVQIADDIMVLVKPKIEVKGASER